MKKDIKKYIEFNKKIKNTEENYNKVVEEIKKIYRNSQKIWLTDEKEKQKLAELNKKEKQLLKCMEIQKIESNLIHNNICSSFFNKYNNKIIEILKKYEGKNIGDKTREKIQDEIKEMLKQDFDYSIYVYLRVVKDDCYKWKDGSLNINFKTKFNNNDWESIFLNIEYVFEKENYNCYDENKKLEKYYYVNIVRDYNRQARLAFYKNNELTQNIVYIENTKELATKLYNHSKKAKMEIEKYKEKMKEIRNNLDDEIKILDYRLQNDMEIPYSIFL